MTTIKPLVSVCFSVIVFNTISVVRLFGRFSTPHIRSTKRCVMWHLQESSSYIMELRLLSTELVRLWRWCNFSLFLLDLLYSTTFGSIFSSGPRKMTVDDERYLKDSGI